MVVIVSVFNRTMNCLEGIFNDTDCKIDSGCCQTYKHVHYKEPIEENMDKNNELKNDFKKSDNNIE